MKKLKFPATCFKLGFGQTRRDVKCLVETSVKQKGTLRGSTITNGWWQKFLKRNPVLRLRAGDSTAERGAAKSKKAEEKQKNSLEKALKRKPTSSMVHKRNKVRGDMDETIHTPLLHLFWVV